MSYKIKKGKKILCFLERVKDNSLLIPGDSYHIRKLLKKDGSIWLDDSHDFILKEFVDGFFVTEETGEKYLVGENEYEIFIRKGL